MNGAQQHMSQSDTLPNSETMPGTESVDSALAVDVTGTILPLEAPTRAVEHLLVAQPSSKSEGAPYAELAVGATLAFYLATPSATIPIQATVLHVYRPFTMSAVLRVQVAHVEDANIPAEAILKLYDRRVLNNMREDFEPPALWNPQTDDDYAQWLRDVADGRVQPINFDDDDDEEWDENALSPGARESYLQYIATTLYSREVAAYSVLANFQGDAIPRMYGTVTYRDLLTPGNVIPGILVEYVPGPTMRELVATWVARTPRPSDAELVRVCEAAVGTMERVAQCETLVNRDARIDNVILRGFDDADGRSPVVIIDLAGCVIQDERPAEDWREWKAALDEVGAIGLPLTYKVARQVGLGVWTYSRILPVREEDL